MGERWYAEPVGLRAPPSEEPLPPSPRVLRTNARPTRFLEGCHTTGDALAGGLWVGMRTGGSAVRIRFHDDRLVRFQSGEDARQVIGLQTVVQHKRSRATYIL